MENVLSPIQSKNNVDADFMPVKQFFDKLTSRETPYKGKFSIQPFLDKRDADLPICENGGDKMMRHMIEEFKSAASHVVDGKLIVEDPMMMEMLTSVMFPSLFFKGQIGFISIPFTKQFIYVTPAMKDLIESDDMEIKIPDFLSRGDLDKPALDVADTILNTFYNFDINLMHKEVFTYRNKKTGLEQHYKVQIIDDFIRGKALKPVKKISEKQIYELLNNYDDTQLWLKHLPPENFEFEGMVIGYLQDVTDVEVLSKIKYLLADETEKTDHESQLNKIQQATRSYIGMPEVTIGMTHTLKSYWQNNSSWNITRAFDKDIMHKTFGDIAGGYGKVLLRKEPFICPDLMAEAHLSPYENLLMESGFRSLLLSPLKDPEGNIIGIFEMASPKPYRFNRFTNVNMKGIIELFALGTSKFIEQLDSSTRLTIQNLFTSIHPSVDWKFQEVAAQYFWENEIEQKPASVAPIVFKNVYPLYAQADIVGSSKLRNRCIEADLKDNLKRVIEVMEACKEAVEFHLLDVYLGKAKRDLARLERGEFISNDESQIVDLLKKEIHPLLYELAENFPKIPKDEIDSYADYLDESLNIVYRHRKAYEESVAALNSQVAQYIEKEDRRMQKILPHFFEKYITDGVEYNMYIGQSLLKDKKFSRFFLKDFRLWQLIKMCEVTRLVNKVGPELPVPLDTAQLIFVFNNTMSIRFNMEEKQFDVDGTYNVRYEILKKRIDKAIVKGTKERLTQGGKISIVWIQEKDRLEYYEYLEHLVAEGYIKDEIEDLELEKMQGVEGLRALRVEVI